MQNLSGENKFHFHVSDFALCLDLKQRLVATQKWPVAFVLWSHNLIFVYIFL